MSDQATAPRVVTLTTAMPHAAIEHAGGKYLNLLFRALGQDVVVVVAPPLPSVLRAVTLPGHPPRFQITAEAGSLARRVENHLRRVEPGLPSFSLRRALRRSASVRHLVAGADVVDLQWQDTIRLARLVRKVAPHARLVGTFHDVQSQKFGRLAAGSTGLRRVKWRLAERVARRSERVAMGVLDHAVVFSDKDAGLLPAGAPVTVVDPPLAAGMPPQHIMPADPRAVFVAFFIRPENHEAALWLVNDVWPRVLDALPEARLDLIGAGMTADLETAVEATPRATSLGFVPDLDTELAGASVAVVPLRDGAGVKFKTIEGLLAGVPVVTTTVGAEGIEPANLFWAVTDSAEAFANAIVTAARDASGAQSVADAAQHAVHGRYSHEAFAKKAQQIYG